MNERIIGSTFHRQSDGSWIETVESNGERLAANSRTHLKADWDAERDQFIARHAVRISALPPIPLEVLRG